MAPTIDDRSIIDELIRSNGKYGDDKQVVKIVKYNNRWDRRETYGVIYEGMDLDTYKESPFVLNPRTIWEANETRTGT